MNRKAGKYLLWISLLLMACGEKSSKGLCTLDGKILNYKRAKLTLYEITPHQNYLVSKVIIDKDGEFELKFKAAEKSIYGLTNGSGFIYFINDVPGLAIETSEGEFDNYFVENSPASEQLRQLVATEKKFATEVDLAQRLLLSKMVKENASFGSDPEIQDLENKADKRSRELREYITTYMDTVRDKLLAIGASSFLPMSEEFNYLEVFYRKIEKESISSRQKEDLRIELEAQRRSFKSIAPVEFVSGVDLEGKPRAIKDLKGRFVLINIWASWCYASREQLPYWKDVYEKYGSDTGFVFIHVSIDDRLDTWREFLAKRNCHIGKELCDTLGKQAAILKRFGLDYIPANFLLGRDGNIITSNLKDEQIMYTLGQVIEKR